MMEILFYVGIGVILFLAGRNLWESWRREKDFEEWTLKGRWREP